MVVAVVMAVTGQGRTGGTRTVFGNYIYMYSTYLGYLVFCLGNIESGFIIDG